METEYHSRFTTIAVFGNHDIISDMNQKLPGRLAVAISVRAARVEV
jgi:hypothetical protein